MDVGTGASTPSLESAAFEALFVAEANAIYAFCARRCGDRVLAEDLLSVVFLEAWRHRHRAIALDGSYRPWLFGIATNVLRNSRRTLRRHSDALARYHMSNPISEHDPADEVAARVDGRSLSARLVQALATLSTKERDVAELCLIQELTIAGAAAALGLPEGTVKSRLARARTRMRRVLRTSESSDPSEVCGHVLHERRSGASVRPE